MQVSRLSTANVEPMKRLDCWNALTAGFFPGMVIDGAADIDASWQSVRLGEVHLCIAKSPRSRVRRWRAQSEVRETGRALFHLQAKGVSNTIQSGASMVAAAGEMSVCSSDRPYEIEISQNNECLVIDCPDDAVPYGALLGRVVSSSSNVHLRLLMDFAMSIFRQGWSNELLDVEEEAHLEEALIALLKNCISSSSAAPPCEDADHGNLSPTELYRRIVQIIENHIYDSSMRTGLIAQRLGVSESAVQKTFAQFGTTPTAYIHARRLEKAKLRLRDPKFDGSLTDLAYDLGFSDSAHFSRRFKAHFKTTPSNFQKQCRARLS